MRMKLHKIKNKKYFYVITKIRGFVSLDNAIEEIKNKDITKHHLYKSFKDANRNCSKIWDGETEMVVGLQIIKNGILPKNEKFYTIALDTPGRNKLYYERRILDIVHPELLNEKFNLNLEE